MHNRNKGRKLRPGTWLVGAAALTFVILAFWYHALFVFAGLMLVMFVILVCMDKGIIGTAAAAEALRPQKPQGVYPPPWVVIGVRYILNGGARYTQDGGEAPPNSVADNVVDLGITEGRFVADPQVVFADNGQFAFVPQGSALTDKDTGVYMYNDATGGSWLLVASDKRGSLPGFDLADATVGATLLIRNRKVPASK